MHKYLIEQTNEKGEVQTYHVSGEYLKDKQLSLRHYIINTCDVSESTKTIIYKQIDLKDKKQVTKRLKYLKLQIENENISYEEIAELQGLKEYIDPNNVVLLEWAGVPEFNT